MQALLKMNHFTVFFFFQVFVKIRNNKRFNDCPEYLPIAASVHKTKINGKRTQQAKNVSLKSQQ